MTAFEKLTFEDATRVIYYQFGNKPAAMFRDAMEDLIASADEPSRCICRKWYDEYKHYLVDNKKGK
jgi:hypothetical protein